MKRYASVVIIAVVLGGIYFVTKPTNMSYTAPEVVEVEKEVQVDALENAIQSAQEAKKSDMEAIAQKAYDDAFTQEMKKIELEVIADFNKKIDARQIELEKETKVY